MQSSRFPPVHCGEEYPVAHADGILSQQAAAIKVTAQGNILQIRHEGLGRIGHHQTVLRPGHGNVQHPHFLGNTFRGHLCPNGPLGKGGVTDAVFCVRTGQAQPQCSVAEDLGPQILLIETPGQVAQKHHRKFQPLGLVDAHNIHTVRSGGAGGNQATFLHPVQVLKELGEFTQTPFLKVTGVLIEGLNIRRFGISAGHGGINAVHPGHQQAFFHQSRQGVTLCLGTEGIKRQKERFRLSVSAGHQRVIKGSIFLLCPDLGQILRRKAKHRACQYADEWNVLPGIHHCLQKAAKRADLLSLQQIGTAAGGAADSKRFQCPLEIPGGTAGRPQKNHNIPGLYRAESIPIPHQCAG